MNKSIDYRQPDFRFSGFDKFYRAMLETNDVSPDMAVERWIADEKNFTFEQRCSQALFHGLTYDGPSEMVLSHEFPTINVKSIRKLNEFYLSNKTETNNRFRTLPPDSNKRWYIHKARLASFEALEKLVAPHKTFGKFIEAQISEKNTPVENYQSLLKAVSPTDDIDIWQVSRRMGTWCFLEALSRFTDIPIEPPNMWFGSEGKNHTAGWAWATNRDDIVDRLINEEKIPYADIESMELAAKTYLDRLKISHPELKNIGTFTLETCCCNYFKAAVKGTHFNLCYIQEQHDVTKIAESIWTDHQWLWDLYWKGRQATIPATMLYENYQKVGDAYVKNWRKGPLSFKETGRMIAVDHYENGQPLPWPVQDSWSLADFLENA